MMPNAKLLGICASGVLGQPILAHGHSPAKPSLVMSAVPQGEG
jgi:hypothetical protein